MSLTASWLSFEELITAPSLNGKRALSVVDLMAYDPDQLPPINWLIEGLVFERGLWLLVGLPKHGKSVVRAHVAACIATGADFFGHKAKQGTVLILADEDTALAERRRIVCPAEAAAEMVPDQAQIGDPVVVVRAAIETALARDCGA